MLNKHYLIGVSLCGELHFLWISQTANDVSRFSSSTVLGKQNRHENTTDLIIQVETRWGSTPWWVYSLASLLWWLTRYLTRALAVSALGISCLLSMPWFPRAKFRPIRRVPCPFPWQLPRNGYSSRLLRCYGWLSVLIWIRSFVIAKVYIYGIPGCDGVTLQIRLHQLCSQGQNMERLASLSCKSVALSFRWNSSCCLHSALLLWFFVFMWE